MENHSAEQSETRSEEKFCDAQRSPNVQASSGTDRQEIEWQYDAPGGLEKVEAWLGECDPRGSGLVLLGGSLKELADTYYDTEDQQLYHAGYALRVRKVGESYEATMKALTPADGVAGNLHRRREISESLESDSVGALLEAPGPVGAHLKTLVGSRKLRILFEVHTRRRAFDLLDGEVADPGEVQTGGPAVRIGEIALDSSEIPLGGGDGLVRLARVEVEVGASAASSIPLKLENFVKAMEEALGLQPTAISKYEAGLSATGQSLPDGKTSREAKDKGSERE